MSTIDNFFNYSKFEARDASGTELSLAPDVESNIKLEIYDAVGVDRLAGVTGSLYYKDGRNTTPIPTSVVISTGSCGLVIATFTIDLVDWQDSTLGMNLVVTSSSAFVYKLDYQVKG